MVKSGKTDWKYWEFLSQQSLLLDTCLATCNCVTRGWYNCTCVQDDEKAWLNDLHYRRKFSPPCVRAVNRKGAFVSHPNGFIVGPHTYHEWLEYGFDTFDYVHDIMSKSAEPDWSKLFFRKEDDFYGAVYSHFYPIFFLMIPQMAGLDSKHGVTNDLVHGVDLYETLTEQEFHKYKQFRGKGTMYTVPKIHRHYCNDIHKIPFAEVDVKNEQKKLVIRNTKHRNKARDMKKHNRKNTWQQAMHFLAKEDNNFDSWYPKIKQAPIWFDKKDQTWVHPPIFKTDARVVRSQKKLIESTIQKWLESGAIFIIDKKDVDLCTPMVLANVQLPGGPAPDPTKKPRLCHDGGYEKAIEVFSYPCKLEDMYSIHNIIRKNDFLSKIDDKRGFHLVLLGSESRKLTCFEYQNRFFAYRVAPFGSPKIPAIFQRANMIVVNYSRTLGCRNSLYLDDRLLMDEPDNIINGVPVNAFCTTALVISGGGFVSIEKSDLDPKTKQEFLGLNLDTVTCEISVPPHKWKVFVDTVNLLLLQNHCTFKELEKLRGKCVSFILTNPMTKLFIRQMNKVIAQLTAKNADPLTKIKFTSELRKELEEWVKLDFLKMRHVWSDLLSVSDLPYVITFTDASSFSACALIFKSNSEAISKQYFFSEEIQKLPIYFKEAIIIRWMLRDNPDIFHQKRILHFCDNQNVCQAYKALGSKVDNMQGQIKKIYIELKKLESTMDIR